MREMHQFDVSYVSPQDIVEINVKRLISMSHYFGSWLPAPFYGIVDRTPINRQRCIYIPQNQWSENETKILVPFVRFGPRLNRLPCCSPCRLPRTGRPHSGRSPVYWVFLLADHYSSRDLVSGLVKNDTQPTTSSRLVVRASDVCQYGIRIL